MPRHPCHSGRRSGQIKGQVTVHMNAKMFHRNAERIKVVRSHLIEVCDHRARHRCPAHDPDIPTGRLRPGAGAGKQMICVQARDPCPGTQALKPDFLIWISLQPTVCQNKRIFFSRPVAGTPRCRHNLCIVFISSKPTAMKLSRQVCLQTGAE